MRRSPELASLSRDHHQTLAIALRLRRARERTAREARDAFLAHWTMHGRTHFRLEEEVLLPAYAGYGDPHHSLVLQALGDHVEIRHRADLVASTPSTALDALHELGTCLAAHVRLEERELFPLIERTMPAAPLTAVAAALEHAGHA